MGFMDRFKDAAHQAQQAAKSAGDSVASMGGMGGAKAEAEKANRIAQHGVKHPAVLKGLRETGKKDSLSGGVEYEIEVEVKPTGAEPYSATFNQQLLEGAIDGYKQKIGGEVVVNVDPEDRTSMLLWG
jgi:hypothetical protein